MPYADWIAAYVARMPFVRGNCKEATAEMVQHFPELRVAAGFVHCSWGRDQHFWCVAPDGSILDPTRGQFDLVYQYEELDLSDPEAVARVPTGVCPNCGGDVYGSDTFCDTSCECRYMAYLNSNQY